MLFVRSWMRHCDNELTTTLVRRWQFSHRISWGRCKEEGICCTLLRVRCQASPVVREFSGETSRFAEATTFSARPHWLLCSREDVDREEGCQPRRGNIVFIRPRHQALMQQISRTTSSPISFYFNRFRVQSLAQRLASWRRRLRISASSARSPLTHMEQAIELRCDH